MRLLALDDLDLESLLADLALAELPLITDRSDRLNFSVRRRQGINGSVFFGGQSDPARWNVVFKPEDVDTRDALIAALSDIADERRILAQRLDVAETRVVANAALVKVTEISDLDFVADFESVDSVWRSESAVEVSKSFLSTLDQAMLLTVPGNTRTVPRIVLTPQTQRTATSALAGWKWRRNYVVTNNSDVPWYKLPIRISLGDTTSLTPTKALANGNDVRVWIDGIERQRTLVTWDTAASHVWYICENLQPGESQTVEVVYGNAAAVSPPVLAYPNLPPFTLSTSTNAQWTYPVDDVVGNSGLGIWHLSDGTPSAVPDYTVPGSWRPALTLNNRDNADLHYQRVRHNNGSVTAWYQAGLAAFRSSAGAQQDIATVQILEAPNAYDGVAVYHPLGISSVNFGYYYFNYNGAGAAPDSLSFVVVGRNSAAEGWSVIFARSDRFATTQTVAPSVKTPATPVRHLGMALWPTNSVELPQNINFIGAVWFDNTLQLNIDTTDLSITGGFEEEIYELATTLRLGGGADGVPPYRAMLVGNALGESGAGTPRAAVVLGDEALVIDAETRTHEVWDLTASEAWTPAALGGKLNAWFKADAITGLADGAAVLTWPDSSGHGHDATATPGANPSYQTNEQNGLPIARFDGVSDDMTITMGVAQPVTFAFVAKDTGTSTDAAFLTTIGATIMVRQIDTDGDDGNMSAGVNYTYSNEGLIGSAYRVHTTIFNGASSLGSLDGTASAPGNAGSTTGATGIIIGSSGSSRFQTMDLGEFIVIDGALSTDDRQLVEGYLAHKWDIALAGGHPYEDDAPTIALPGTKVEDASAHAITAVVGVDERGETVIRPSNEILPLTPSRTDVPNHDFLTGIAEWTGGTDPLSDVYTLQATYGSTGTGNDNFDTPAQVAVSPFDGHVYIADTANNRVIKRNGTTGAYISQIALTSPARGVAVDTSGNVYTTESDGAVPTNTRLRKFNTSHVQQWNVGTGLTANIAHCATDGTNVWVAGGPGQNAIFEHLCSTGADTSGGWGTGGTGDGQFSDPWGVAHRSGEVYVVDRNNERVQVFNTAGVFQRKWGSSGSGDGQFAANTARGIAIDTSGDAWVADFGNDRVQQFTNIGTFLNKFTQTDPDGVAVATGDVVWVSNATTDNLATWDQVTAAAVRSWDGAVGGEAVGSLKVAMTAAPSGSLIATNNDKVYPINGREAIELAAWVLTDNVNLVPRLQIIFADENEVTIITETEPVWVPVAATEYVHVFAARVPARATQYRIAGTVSVGAAGVTGNVWFDEFSLNAPTLYVSDIAMGELDVDVSIQGRWL